MTDLPWHRKLRIERQIRNLSIKEAAERVGVHPNTWWTWEVGIKRPVSKAILKNLEAAGFPLPEEQP